jgi:hypothetical protein
MCYARAVLLLRLPLWIAAQCFCERLSWKNVVRRKHSPCSSSVIRSLCFPPLQLFLGAAAATILGWIGRLFIHQFAVTAVRDGILLLLGFEDWKLPFIWPLVELEDVLGLLMMLTLFETSYLLYLRAARCSCDDKSPPVVSSHSVESTYLYCSQWGVIIFGCSRINGRFPLRFDCSCLFKLYLWISCLCLDKTWII